MTHHSRPLRVLDLFSGAGGAGMGYHRAGFEVVGVDVKPQPRYPFEFHRLDALEALTMWKSDGAWPGLHSFDVIHASPPCQVHTALKSMWNAREHPDFLPQTREALQAIGKPYVIENVPGAPLDVTLMLCGSMFDLHCEVAELRRHRLFESNVLLYPPGPCNHGFLSITVSGHSPTNRTQHSKYSPATITVAGGHPRDPTLERRRYGTVTGTGAVSQQNVKRNEIREIFSVDQARQAMGIDWMPMSELSQAIPPAYTEWIGQQLMRAIA